MSRAVTLAALLLAGLAGVVAGQYALPQTGLHARYFTNLNRSGPPAAVAIDPTADTERLRRGTASAWASFSVEWSGAIVITRGGTYHFATVSDDGSELEVADVTVVRNGGLHGPQEASGRIELAPGVHPIRVRYEQAGGDLFLQLKYGLEGETPVVIPPSLLLPDPMSLAEYRARAAIPPLSGLIAIVLFARLQRLRLGEHLTTKWRASAFDNPRIAIAAVVLVAIVVRILMMFGSNAILWADSEIFLETADAIRAGRWLDHDPFRTLLYPYFLAPFLDWSTERPMDQVIVGAQHLLGVATVVGCFAVARAAFGTGIALGGALVLALHTTQLFYEKSILTEALFGCLLMLALLVVLAFLRQPTFARAVGVAAACLVLTMTRPAAQAYVLVPAVLTLLVAAGWRRRAALAATMLAVYAVSLLPWMSVNQRMFGFHGVALGRGLGLFIRTSQIDRYEPSLYRDFPEIAELLTFARTTQSATGHVVDGLRRRGYSSARTDDLLYRASLSAISQRPLQFAGSSIRQWWRQLGSLDDEDICTGAQGAYLCSDRTIGYAREPFLNRPRHADEPIRRMVVDYFRNCRIPMHVVTVLAAFGAIAGMSTRSPVFLARALIALTIIYFTLLPAITQSLQDRFRLPVDGVLFAVALFGLVSFVRIALGRQSAT